jgi:hypothetical protein
MNIVLSLTTVPNRLHEHHGHSATRAAITTLLEQSYSGYSVHLNIPIEYRGQSVTIPEWVNEYKAKYQHLSVYQTPDYGSITKIIPTLERIDDPETMIILADDDLYYMGGLVEAHVNGRNKYPNCALGFAGMASVDGSCHFCTTVTKDVRVKVLEGYKTVSYLRKFFDLDELKQHFLGKSWRDDETLSAYMGYKNIPKIVMSYEGDTDFSPRVESFPVIGHVPAERGGCNMFRDDEAIQNVSENNIQEFFKLGYLER